MAKKRSPSRLRRILGTILTGIVLMILVILSQVTGIDFIELFGLDEQLTPVTTTIPAGPTTVASANVATLNVGQGFGYSKGFWQVYFNAPTGSSDFNTYVNGIDVPLANAINAAQRSVDVAAFEMNNDAITDALIAAHERGVQVRVVTDDEFGIEDEDTTVIDLEDAGIPVVDDARTGLMHNKFMIIDGVTVWTGSWNYTVNGTYRNNNNAIVLRSRRAVETYQAEFNEMFQNRAFGSDSPAGSASFMQDGVPVEIYFAPEDDPNEAIIRELNAAQRSIKFMAFSYTLDEMRDAMLQRSSAGVNVQGIFEVRGSETEFSELTPLFCAGLPMRQDGNPYVLHHKVIIIDNSVVLTGSFNFSQNATRRNDENLLIMRDPALAALYSQEFDRRWAEAQVPNDLTCN